jgi:cytoskeleton protein RodZ
VTSLSNLEAGAFDKLPGHTFARGYIRAYAKLLGMDQTVLVQQFDQSTGTDSQGSNVHALGRIEEPVRVSHTILRIVSLLLLIAVIGGGFVWWQDQTSLRTKDLTSLAPEHVEVEGADGTTQIHPIDEPEDQAVEENQADTSTTLALPQSETTAESTGAEGAAPATTPTAPAATPTAPVHTPAPVVATPATPAPNVPATPAPTVTAPVVPVAPAASAEAVAPVAGDGQVQLQFSADCWAQVTDGRGKVIFSGLKHKGDSVSVSGKPPLNVRLGVARAAQVSYNGQPVDIAPFTSGETARLKLGQ